MRPSLVLTAAVLACRGAAAEPPTFVDATETAGLGGLNSARLCLADLNEDGRPDAVVRCREPGKPDRYRVFINGPGGDGRGVRFKELAGPTGLPTPRDGDCLVFADLDGDGHADAVFTRYLDVNNETFAEPDSEPKRTAWLKGRGDGTFGPPCIIDAARPATTACIAVGDVGRDGLLDLYLGNWYTKYGASNDGFTNDLLLQGRPGGGGLSWAPHPVDFASVEEARAFTDPIPAERLAHTLLPDPEKDQLGRPTYGVMIVDLVPGGWAELLELSYGRRWNRLWLRHEWPFVGDGGGGATHGHIVSPTWTDTAPALGLDGDEVRHGRYPDWLKEVARKDSRFDREDEQPFRANGNTFDAAVGDIDNDGDFDLFLAEITHAWAGDSSDRSRFLVNEGMGPAARSPRSAGGGFVSPPRLSVDRIPPIPPRDQWPEGWYPRWNQGDLFCELADLDHDGRLDLILSSGDYPDPPPYDQRLRIFHQQEDGTFTDVTAPSGVDHPGSQQISLGDVDLDGDLDILVGQSFNRFTKEMIDARTPPGPVARLFLNQTVEKRAAAGKGPGSIVLKLVGDEAKGVNRDALGATVEVVAPMHGGTVRQLRQLIGIGGHAGKQHEFIVHVGIGDADAADLVTVHWPGNPEPAVLHNVPPGRREVRAGR